jgi:hypothetical protein
MFQQIILGGFGFRFRFGFGFRFGVLGRRSSQVHSGWWRTGTGTVVVAVAVVAAAAAAR